MEIILRKDAVARGLSQYFTGKPCRNGHTTYRYTSSGTCAACVNGSESPRAQFAGTMIQAKTVRNEALANLADIKVRCWHGSAAQVRNIAAAICLGQYPFLTRADVAITAAATGTEGGHGLYRVRVPQEQVELMVETAKAMFFAARGPVDFSSTRQALAEKINEYQGEAPPAWTEKP